MKIHALVATAGLAVALSAQDITATATSTPVFLAANSGANSETRVLSLAQATSSLGAFVIALSSPVAVCRAGWTVESESDRLRTYSYGINGVVAGNGPGSATVGSHDVVIELTSAVPRLVSLTWTIDRTALAGPVPLFDVDILDDGVLDGPGSQTGVLLGTQPYRIRIRAQGSASSAGGGAGNFRGQFNLDVTPDNNVNILTAVQGCGPEAFVHESFTGGGIEAVSPAANLLVVGFGAQPTLLPSASSPIFPCLLYPQPDIVVPLGFEGLVVPIPPAARPIGFFVQAIRVLAPQDLRTTQAFYVNAR